jgi:hypothetical protein
MKAAPAIALLLLICLSATDCYAQTASNFQNVGGDFGRSWMARFGAQNPQPVQQNLTNDLWSWGGSPKGTIVINGQLMTDPYNYWKSLNYTSGWLGKVYTDPTTGYPIYGYIDPYTGMEVNYYIDPKTGKPVYTNENSYYGWPYNGNTSPYYFDYLSTGYALPPIFI